MNAARDLAARYTYGDYKTWDDGLRWELIDGEAFCMSPGPGTNHQVALRNLALPLLDYFQNGRCDVFLAPFDVMLPAGDEVEDEIDTVVQPDIVILCDSSKLRNDGIKGAPDVAFEILSPSTGRRDLTDKLYLYERAGVREYVVVDTDNKVVTVFRRDGGRTFSRREARGENEMLELESFPDLKIPLEAVFKNIPVEPS